MSRQRFTRSALLALTFAALVAPAAGAQQDLRNPDQISPAATESQDLRSPDAVDSAGPERQDLRNPDQSSPAATESQDLRSADAIDSAGPERPDVVFVKVPSAAPADGLDWGDAGIGAGGLLALGMIGLGGTLLVVHHRRATA